MRDRSDRKTEWLFRSGSVAAKNEGQPEEVEACEEAEARNTHLENEKLAGEIAQQPLQTEQLEAEIVRDRAGARASDFSVYRQTVLLILLLVLIIFILVLYLVNPLLLETLAQVLARMAPR